MDPLTETAGQLPENWSGASPGDVTSPHGEVTALYATASVSDPADVDVAAGVDRDPGPDRFLTATSVAATATTAMAAASGTSQPGQRRGGRAAVAGRAPG